MNGLQRRFRVTHPFHPHHGKEFELLEYRNNGRHRYLDYFDGNGLSCGIPFEWTDAGEVDPFIELACGRSFFHINDLLRLCDLLQDLSGKIVNGESRCKENDAVL